MTDSLILSWTEEIKKKTVTAVRAWNVWLGSARRTSDVSTTQRIRCRIAHSINGSPNLDVTWKGHEQSSSEEGPYRVVVKSHTNYALCTWPAVQYIRLRTVVYCVRVRVFWPRRQRNWQLQVPTAEETNILHQLFCFRFSLLAIFS